LLLVSFHLPAQETIREFQGGKIKVHEPTMVHKLPEKHAAFIKDLEEVDGYRIQISSTKNYQAIPDIRDACKRKLPDLKVYVTYKAPYYKIRLGDYLTYIDTYADYARVLEKYPTAIIVRDKVKLSELK